MELKLCATLALCGTKGWAQGLAATLALCGTEGWAQGLPATLALCGTKGWAQGLPAQQEAHIQSPSHGTTHLLPLPARKVKLGASTGSCLRECWGTISSNTAGTTDALQAPPRTQRIGQNIGFFFHRKKLEVNKSMEFNRWITFSYLEA